jgi:hypothetical protein
MKGLENTLNGMGQDGECSNMMAFGPLLRAQETKTQQISLSKELAYNPILKVQTLDACRQAHAAMDLHWQTSIPLELELGDSNAGEGKDNTGDKELIEIDGTSNRQPDGAITNHAMITKNLQGQCSVMNDRGVFNSVTHTRNFCCKHIKGTQLQEVIILKNVIVQLQSGMGDH